MSRRSSILYHMRALDFDSGAEEPGKMVEIGFPVAGSFPVFCGIHPKMELYVDVAR